MWNKIVQIRDLPLRRQIFFSIFLTVIIVIAAGTIINFFIIRHEFVRTIDRDMENAFLHYLEKINNTTNEMIANGKVVALAGETLFQIYSAGTHGNPQAVCERFLIRKVEQIPVILGSGLWYEQYQFAGNQFFGPYAYHDTSGKVKITWEYNTKKYNYVAREWYTIAIPLDWDRTKKREKDVYITRPYGDILNGEKITFLTMSIPMYSEQGRIIGVSTTDWNVEVIRNYLSYLREFSFTSSSYIMLVEEMSGTILYHTNKDYTLKNFSELQLSSFINTASSVKMHHIKNVPLNGKRYDVLYKKTDLGFLLIMAVPPAESYSRLTKTLLAFCLLAVVVIGIIIFLVSRFIDERIIQRISIINNRITEIEKGNYSGSIAFTGKDELAHIANNIHAMTQTILQRERQLTTLKQYFLNIIDSMPSMLISLDHRGTVTHWNAAAMRITGISTDNAIGKCLWDMVPEFGKYREDFEKTIASGSPRILLRETLLYDERKIFTVSIFPLAAGEESGIVFRFDDITEMEQKEMQLRQVQKLEIVGVLAGGLAHDFNNVLAAIIGTTSLLKHLFKKNNDVPIAAVQKSIEVIDESAKRAADIVQQLLVLSRKKEMAFEAMNINQAVKHVLKICSSTFDKSIEVQFHPFESPAMVYADPVQIEQVILNLCVNASHSMTLMKGSEETQGGILVISVDSLHSDEHFVKTQPEASLNTDYWILSVRDTGVGMEQKIVSKIFEPFFTTKPTGSGTGLGLPMVYSIIKQHNGFINVYSEPKIGSTFNVYIPALIDCDSLVKNEKSDAIPTGSGVILVIDDEPAIRATAKAILEICGYTVLLAENGEQGLTIFKERHQEIAAVLLDMVMPKLSGRNTYLAIKEIKSDVKVLLSSGFRLDERVEEIMNLGVNGFIQKPYTVERLACAIWDIIYKV